MDFVQSVDFTQAYEPEKGDLMYTCPNNDKCKAKPKLWKNMMDHAWDNSHGSEGQALL